MPRFSFWLITTCLFGTLVFFSLDNLTESPPTWFDEGIYLQVAVNDALHGVHGIQLAPGTFASTAFVTGGFPFLSPISWAFQIFGIGILQARLVMVFFILACSGTAFALIRKLFGDRIALMSLLLLVTFPPLFGQGKNVLGEVPGLFFFVAFLYCMHMLETRAYQGLGWYLAAGLTSGLCIATKPIFALVGFAVLIAIAYLRHSIEFRWKEIAAGVAAFAIPIGFWFSQQFSQADSASEVAAYYANPYGIADLNAQIFANLLRFVTELSPSYFFLLVCIWSISVLIRAHRKERLTLVESVAFIFTWLVVIAYLRTAGWYRYFFVAEVPALIFLPHALRVIFERIRSGSQIIYATCAVTLLFVCIQGYQLLFGSWVATHTNRTTTHALRAYVSTLPETDSFFIYNTPAAAIFIAERPYSQYLIPNPRVDLGREQLAALTDGTIDFVVTNSRDWQSASTTFTNFTQEKDIDGIIFARKNAP